MTLTERQDAVMSLLARGFTKAEIAAALGVTRGVVYHELNAIKSAIDAKTTEHAVAMWMESTPNPQNSTDVDLGWPNAKLVDGRLYTRGGHPS